MAYISTLKLLAMIENKITSWWVGTDVLLLRTIQD